MIILDATTKSLEAVLGGAVTANQLPIVASYVDVTTTTYTPASNDTATNNTTAVTIVAAPAASTQRQVKLLTVYNADTAAATVTVRVNNNSTTRILCKTTLAVGDTLVYTDGEGFRVIDSDGTLQSGSSSVSAHTLLDGGTAHTDTASQAVTRGSLIYGNTTPKWDELVVGAANTILKTDGSDPAWATLTTVLDFVGGAAQGDILYRTGSAWDNLAAGTSGQFLKTLGAAANPAWATIFTSLSSIEIINKPDTETVTNSTTLQDDNDIQFTLAANQKSYFFGILFCFGAQAGDIKLGFYGSAAGADGVFGVFGPEIGTTDSSNTNIRCGAVGISTSGSGIQAIGMDGAAQIPLCILGYVKTGANTQTIKLEWAQNTANGTATEIRGEAASSNSFIIVFKS